MPASTFGFSVAGGIDVDGNDYPDMAVGAYLANSAFFFRSRPVVRVEAFVRFRTENKQIDIRKRNCNVLNGQRATCTSIDFCIKYGGKGIPQQIRLDVQYILDTKKPTVPRMAFVRKNARTLNDTITLYKDGRDTCQTEEIYIKNDIRDKLTQLEAEVKYFMIQEDIVRDASHYGRVRNPQSQLRPVLDLNLPPSRKDYIVIQKNCGHDDVCVPNLHVNVTKNVEKYLLDSKTNLEFDIIVSNSGEDSFETTLDLTYPEGIYYKITEVRDDMHGILCSPGENRTISCDVGNPLPANKIAKFRMIFVPYHKQGMSPTYEFDVYVNSTNPEDNSTLEDNHSHVTVDIWVDSSLDVSGRSIPQEIYLPNASQYKKEEIFKESDIGPQVTHLYTLRNKGPATIYEAEMYFLWPWQTLSGEDLLYLLEQPHVPEGVKCEIPAPANYKNYQLDYNVKPIWERLQIDSSSSATGRAVSSFVKIESGTNITGVAGGARVAGHGTNLLDEEVRVSGGDASNVHEKRQNASAIGAASTGTGLDSTGRISKAGQTVYTKSEWRTVVINGQPITKWTNVTTVKDATGKIIDTYYSTDDTGGDQVASGSSNVDNFGRNIGGYKQYKTKPKIIYTSSGNVDAVAAENEDLSLSASVKGANEETDAKQDRVYEQNAVGGTSKAVEEKKHYEEHAYTVGGGSREGGGTSTEVYEQEQVISIPRGQQQQGAPHQVTAGAPTLSATDQNEARRRYEERRQYEERLRQRQQNEERIRLQEERSRQQAYEEQYRIREEERRRQQLDDEEQRRAQQVADEERRRQQLAYEESRRREQALEERRRLEEERRRQWQQVGNGGSSVKYSEAGRKRTGYFDARGNYHDEVEGGAETAAVLNKTWSTDGTSQGGQSLGLGQAAVSGGGGGGGGGFRTQTIDLGMLGGDGDGVGDHNREVSASAGRHQWVSAGQRTRGGTFSGTLEGGPSPQDQYTGNEWQRGRWEEAAASPPIAHNHVERDNVPTDGPDLTSNRRRGRRQAAEMDPVIDEVLKCTATRCFYVKCTVGTLEKDAFISIALRSRLNVRAVKHLSNTQPVKLSSMMVARISKLPYIGEPKEQALHSHEIFTEVPAGEPERAPHFVPLWIVLLSAFAGTLILLLVVLLLYKCGFFKRKRPSAAPERQPLNRNGYQHGDEAL